MALKDTMKRLGNLLDSLTHDLRKAEAGNKAASQRVRTCTIKLAKVAKDYRKESVKAEKSGSFKKKKKVAKKPAKKKAVKKKVAKKKVVKKKTARKPARKVAKKTARKPARKVAKRKVAKKTARKPARRKKAKR